MGPDELKIEGRSGRRTAVGAGGPGTTARTESDIMIVVSESAARDGRPFGALTFDGGITHATADAARWLSEMAVLRTTIDFAVGRTPVGAEHCGFLCAAEFI